MSWYLGGPNLSSITELLDNPDTTVEMVLNDSALNAALRTGLDSLFSFFFDIEDHLTHLLNMVLTDYVPISSAIPAKTTRMALQVLTMPNSNKLIEKLKNNSLFLQRIVDFPNSEYATNTRACGHYGRIIEAFARATYGEFLKNVPTLQDFLKKKMINLGLRELFTTLITDFPSSFGVSKDYFIEITTDPPENTMFYIISGIALAIPNKKDFISYINNVQFVKNLFALAKKEQSTMCRVSIQACLLIDKIIPSMQQDQELKALLAEESSNFDFTQDLSQTLLGAVLRILTTKEDKVLLKILEKGNSTFINDGIIRSFQLFTDEELQQFNERNNFCNRIMALFPQTKTNAHLSKLVKIFNKINSGNEEWNKFVTDVANPREEQRTSNYGGPRPQLESDASSDEDSDNLGNDDGEALFEESDSSSSADLSMSSDDDDDDDDDLSTSGSDDDDDESFSSDYESSSDSDDSDDDAHKRPLNKLHKFGSIPISNTKNHHHSMDEEEDIGQVQMVPAPPIPAHALENLEDFNNHQAKFDADMNFDSSSNSSGDSASDSSDSDEEHENPSEEHEQNQQPEENQQEQNQEQTPQENNENKQKQNEVPSRENELPPQQQTESQENTEQAQPADSETQNRPEEANQESNPPAESQPPQEAESNVVASEEQTQPQQEAPQQAENDQQVANQEAQPAQQENESQPEENQQAEASEPTN